MDSAQEIFNQIKKFKRKDKSGKSSEQRLLEYCKNFLGSAEHLCFDYKEKEDRSHPELGDRDKKNLAKGLSGFANSSGGVLIWGIKDDEIEAKPITNPQGFLANLLSLSKSICDPVVQGINGDWLQTNQTNDQGYVFVLIPESTSPPHRVILKEKDVQNQYYQRSGDSFIVASHTQLEDMFGRRPKPELQLAVIIKESGNVSEKNVHLIIGIENIGRGVAKYPFLSIKLNSRHEIFHYGIDGNTNFGLLRIITSVQTKEVKYGATNDRVILSGMILEVTAIELENVKKNSEISDIDFDYIIAAEGVKPVMGRKIINGIDIYDQAWK